MHYDSVKQRISAEYHTCVHAPDTPHKHRAQLLLSAAVITVQCSRGNNTRTEPDGDNRCNRYDKLQHLCKMKRFLLAA